jgi:hypothetical protein
MNYTEGLCSGSKNGSRYTNEAKRLYLSRLQSGVREANTDCLKKGEKIMKLPIQTAPVMRIVSYDKVQAGEAGIKASNKKWQEGTARCNVNGNVYEMSMQAPGCDHKRSCTAAKGLATAALIAAHPECAGHTSSTKRCLSGPGCRS